MATIIKGRPYEFVAEDNSFMRMAREEAKRSSDPLVMTGAVIVIGANASACVVGKGANRSEFHIATGRCIRKERGCKTGEGYELCEGCQPHNHAEPSAIRDAEKDGQTTAGADLYLWGHWWACEDCWKAIETAGIKRVFLLRESGVLFDRENPGNILGKQFAV